MKKNFFKNIEVFFLILVFFVSFYLFYTGNLNKFSLVFFSIVLEALPFMVIGSVIGGIIEVYMKPETVTAIIPKNKLLSALFGAALGIVFPVCECAIVPVTKRLAIKGMNLPAVVAYLLGGPIVNPVVFASTVIAYGGEWKAGLIRIVTGYAIAVITGLTAGFLFKEKTAFINFKEEKSICPCSIGHEANDKAVNCCDNQKNIFSFEKKINNVFKHASEDFFSVTHYLIIGAFIAALSQFLISRRDFAEFSHGVFFEPLVMISLAVLLNLCSEADAFIAASFRGVVSFPSQMAFLLTGPMFDLKLLLMYKKLFKPSMIKLIAVSVISLVFISSLIMWFLGLKT